VGCFVCENSGAFSVFWYLYRPLLMQVVMKSSLFVAGYIKVHPEKSMSIVLTYHDAPTTSALGRKLDVSLRLLDHYATAGINLYHNTRALQILNMIQVTSYK
jgi:hypothetical protein